MAAFTVHEPPHSSGTPLQRAESLVFVRDGFSWRAALFSPFYFLVRGEWLGLAAYAGAALVLAGILALTDAHADWIAWIFVLLNVIAGFEANELKRWSLTRRGWQEIATVSGRGREEAERRFFDAWLPTVSSDTSRVAGNGPWSSPADDLTSRVEASVQRLAARLRSRFAVKT
ncbi:DUF2628 domain-containing protein [Hyphomicrobium sp.]|uniref:DUF2628 domain-containing protein n=1 Tax=Hyphomicrobium sp. TaxID=82 RepID=UPI002E33D723|nr:DUF2628 domain-containing protein [Hyphomicrobium sp.]HEX2840912.1 DUF2628 domain-containing protein [Hyphomicrobium sp.]